MFNLSKINVDSSLPFAVRDHRFQKFPLPLPSGLALFSTLAKCRHFMIKGVP